MRGFVLVLSVLLGIGLVFWLAPSLVPQPIRTALATAQSAVNGAVIRPAAAADEPVWPNAVEKSAKHGVQRRWVLLGGLVMGGAAVALMWMVRRRRSHMAESVPAWLAAARTLAGASSNSRERQSHCDLIEKRLLPDMKHRGEAALARAHQLDLYWRYVARANVVAKMPTHGPKLEELRDITKQTLESIAVAPGGRAASAFQQAQPSLWALDAGDARELRRYYDQLGALFADHQKAWDKALAAIDKPGPDHAHLLDSMEQLRQINRTIAKESAALVGDIEISVRAMS